MKKTILITLGFFVILFMTAYYFLFQISLNNYRGNYKQFLIQNPQELKKIEILPSELYKTTSLISWDNNNTEILIDNKAFDIVFVRSFKDVIELYVVSDEEEDNLREKFKKQSAALYGREAGQDQGGKLLKDFLTLEFISGLGAVFSTINSSVLSYYLKSFIPCEGYLSLITPPPVA